MKNLFLGLSAAAALALAVVCGGDGGAAPRRVAVAAVGLDQKQARLMTGETIWLTATVYPLGADNRDVAWASSDDKIASVAGDGLTAAVRAVVAGQATITVTTADGGLSDICLVTVDDGEVRVTGLSLDKTSIALVQGLTDRLEAILQPGDATNQNVAWTSSAPAVAAVVPAGPSSAFVTAVAAAGSAVITATASDGGWTAACAVTVGPHDVPVFDIGLNRQSISLFPGGSHPLIAVVAPVNATEGLTWTTSDGAVATVADTGRNVLVMGVAAGTATITVTASGGKTASCAVTVEDGQAAVVANPTTIAGGYEHSLAVKVDGSIWIWGINEYGQLGDGTFEPRNVPAQLGEDTDWVAVSAGYRHSVALKADGSLWAWGENDVGQLGDGSWTDRNVPTRVGADSDWAKVSVSWAHTHAIKADGSLWAWGFNNTAQLGDGTSANRNVPTRVGADTDWTAVSGGGNHTMAIKENGTLWAWGDNWYGQLGLGTWDDRRAEPVQVGTDADWTLVSSGINHVLALKADGSLWIWGWNNCGQLGIGFSSYDNDWRVPLRLGGDYDWASVSGSANHSVALKKDGTLWAWGSNFDGQLGDGTFYTELHVPTQVGGASGWTAAVGIFQHTMAVHGSGLWAWGYNRTGQLGNGTNTNQALPVLVGMGFDVPDR
jgi:alpha-tubulin suppressor-like RCC1 family protein